MNDYISKPVRLADLDAILISVLIRTAGEAAVAS
jgi:hypothetical protein